MIRLPDLVERSEHARRVAVALRAAEGAGAALRQLRGASHAGVEIGDQLKTAIDKAAEGWVLGYLQGDFADDSVLSEEAFEASGADWRAPEAFWTVDAIDGTRSYVDGFDGFCVQLAWIEQGVVRVGIVHEPVHARTYVGVHGAGAYRIDADGFRRLVVEPRSTWPSAPLFVDSTVPGGRVGEIFRRARGTFLELGSIGLKLCRVADGSADVFVKKLAFKLWDVAPAQVVLSEAGASVGLWDGSAIPYDTSRVRFENVLAAPRGLFELVATELTASTPAA